MFLTFKVIDGLMFGMELPIVYSYDEDDDKPPRRTRGILFYFICFKFGIIL